MDSNDLTKYDETAREITGKPIADCNAADLNAIVKELRNRATRQIAIVDQMHAALKDAERCDCQIAAPINPDGSTDFSRGCVAHTCGK